MSSSRVLPTQKRDSTRRRNSNRLHPSKAGLVIQALEEAFSTAEIPSGTEFGAIRLQYLKDSVWTKYADPRDGESYVSPAERKQAAIAKWQLAELRNARTNDRLVSKPVDFGHFTSAALFGKARKIIASTLGASPRLLVGEFSGGASTRIKRSEVAIPQKFEGRPHSTAEAAHYFGALGLEYPLWGHLNPEAFDVVTVPGSVMFTVPKNSKIDRVACKEPEINMFLQRAAGRLIGSRLKDNGIDLRDQSINQRLCRDGKRRGYATLDLSSASDTISREIVRLLLPADWFALLDDLRVKEVSVPDSQFRHRLEMFSSMGNGFTFELESLLFWALTRSVAYLLGVKGKISVFGDDIICPIPVAKLICRVFAYCGFIVNAQKSCISGHYRESCGAHWYGTQSITPFYIRRKPKLVGEVINITNQLLAWMLEEENPSDIPVSLMGLWGYLASLIPQALYGGQSLERSDALVTGHAPRRVLRVRREVEDVPMTGAYLWWHFGKGESLREFSPSDIRIESQSWDLRRNTGWYEGSLMFSVQLTMVTMLEIASTYPQLPADSRT